MSAYKSRLLRRELLYIRGGSLPSGWKKPPELPETKAHITVLIRPPSLGVWRKRFAQKWQDGSPNCSNKYLHHPYNPILTRSLPLFVASLRSGPSPSPRIAAEDAAQARNSADPPHRPFLPPHQGWQEKSPEKIPCCKVPQEAPVRLRKVDRLPRLRARRAEITPSVWSVPCG